MAVNLSENNIVRSCQPWRDLCSEESPQHPAVEQYLARDIILSKARFCCNAVIAFALGSDSATDNLTIRRDGTLCLRQVVIFIRDALLRHGRRHRTVQALGQTYAHMHLVQVASVKIVAPIMPPIVDIKLTWPAPLHMSP